MRDVHARGVVHRDLKLSNIILTAGSTQRRPQCRLVDFGLARRAAASSASSLAGDGAGTPVYQAPEVLLGQSATPAADVYAFAIVMWEVILPSLFAAAALLFS
jgi:serine/threonine protein kinase